MGRLALVGQLKIDMAVVVKLEREGAIDGADRYLFVVPVQGDEVEDLTRIPIGLCRTDVILVLQLNQIDGLLISRRLVGLLRVRRIVCVSVVIIGIRIGIIVRVVIIRAKTVIIRPVTPRIIVSEEETISAKTSAKPVEAVKPTEPARSSTNKSTAVETTHPTVETTTHAAVETTTHAPMEAATALRYNWHRQEASYRKNRQNTLHHSPPCRRLCPSAMDRFHPMSLHRGQPTPIRIPAL